MRVREWGEVEGEDEGRREGVGEGAGAGSDAGSATNLEPPHVVKDAGGDEVAHLYAQPLRKCLVDQAKVRHALRQLL